MQSDEVCRVGRTSRFPDSTKLTDRPHARVCECASVFVVRFKWQNSLECEQVSAQYYFLGSLVGVLIQSGGERQHCERLAEGRQSGLFFYVVFCFVFFFLPSGAGRGFGARDDHGGGLPQLHQVPHVCLQFPHLCKYSSLFPLPLKGTLSGYL